MEQYLLRKGWFYRDLACDAFSSPKKRIQDFFPKLSNIHAISFEKVKITRDDILYAQEIASSYTFTVLHIPEKNCVIKVPKSSSLTQIQKQIDRVNGYNELQDTDPLTFPKTAVLRSSTDTEKGIVIQEFIPGRKLSLRALESNTTYQEQFQHLIENVCSTLQKYHRRQTADAITFSIFLHELKAALLGKKRSLDELLKNFIIDEGGQIRVVSFYVLEMDLESLQRDIRSRARRVLDAKETTCNIKNHIELA